MNYLNMPLVYLNGSQWGASMIELMSSVPYICESFVLTFDIHKKTNVDLVSLIGVDLHPFYVKFGTPNNTYFVYFVLSLDFPEWV